MNLQPVRRFALWQLMQETKVEHASPFGGELLLAKLLDQQPGLGGLLPVLRPLWGCLAVGGRDLVPQMAREIDGPVAGEGRIPLDARIAGVIR